MSAGYDLVKGLKVTFKELFKKSVTDKYPKEFRKKPQRFHGRHVLNKYEDGMEKCIGCELCAGVCPAQCIYVCLLYTSPSPRDGLLSRMPSSA